jgi:hypothetical protein
MCGSKYVYSPLHTHPPGLRVLINFTYFIKRRSRTTIGRQANVSPVTVEKDDVGKDHCGIECIEVDNGIAAVEHLVSDTSSISYQDYKEETEALSRVLPGFP